MSTAPGEQFEVRQTSTSEDYTPDPSKSLPLSPARQALVDDIIALYSCEPTIKRVERYTPDCVYDDQFVYANDRYKMAGQWFALPKLFKDSKNEGYQVIRSDNEVIQFKNEQSWTFKLIPKTATINALVSLSLDPATVDSDFIQVKYHKDQVRSRFQSKRLSVVLLLLANALDQFGSRHLRARPHFKSTLPLAFTPSACALFLLTCIPA